MKKRMLLIALFFSMASVAMGKVSTRVCLADGNTPWEPQDIMVGTKLTIIVDSDVNEYWSGGLLISGTNTDYGVLSGRDYNEITLDWKGSRFDAAGDDARVWDSAEPGFCGFDLLTTDVNLSSIEAGDWFIVDYNAMDIGDCEVEFYDYGVSRFVPIDYLPFHHVRTRDFDKSTKVDFADFAIFSLYWQESGYTDPNWCEGTDLDTDGTVDINDLKLFFDYWLVRTE